MASDSGGPVQRSRARNPLWSDSESWHQTSLPHLRCWNCKMSADCVYRYGVAACLEHHLNLRDPATRASIRQSNILDIARSEIAEVLHAEL